VGEHSASTRVFQNLWIYPFLGKKKGLMDQRLSKIAAPTSAPESVLFKGREFCPISSKVASDSGNRVISNIN